MNYEELFTFRGITEIEIDLKIRFNLSVDFLCYYSIKLIHKYVK